MKSILIVDDAPFVRRTLRKILTEAGFTVAGEAENGDQALALYQSLKPDLVTMDITMPERDGIDAVRGIMQLDPGARIVMCSAVGQQDKVVDAVKAGAKDFIMKPFKKERVLSAIEGALQK